MQHVLVISIMVISDRPSEHLSVMTEAITNFGGANSSNCYCESGEIYLLQVTPSEIHSEYEIVDDFR